MDVLKYAIFSCRKTKRLVVEYRSEFGVYSPMVKKRVLSKKTGQLEYRYSPAIQGVVFCPLKNAVALRRALPKSIYMHRPFYRDGRFAVVDVKELLEMQSALEREQLIRAEPTVATSRFKVGDQVKVSGVEMFRYIKGTITRFRSNGDARIQLDSGFSHVEVHQTLLDFI